MIDGEFKGGVTRFINHSCDPNLAIFAVSFYRGNPKIYELAFFALEDIPAFTELTFDYREEQDGQDDEESSPSNGIARCLCGAKNCRQWLWL